MNIEVIISIVTVLITMIFGIISKKSKFISNNLIPLQNIIIGLVVALVEYLITKDFSTAIAVSGLIAGGTYDVIHNLNKIAENEQK